MGSLFEGRLQKKTRLKKIASDFRRIYKLKQPFYQAPSSDNGEAFNHILTRMHQTETLEVVLSKLRVKSFETKFKRSLLQRSFQLARKTTICKDNFSSFIYTMGWFKSDFGKIIPTKLRALTIDWVKMVEL